jgi:hypothetical protein
MAKGLLSPPSKAIIFNRNLINNDGLLTNQISVEDKISYSEAGAVINDFVAQCKTDLSFGKRVDIADLGVLYSDAEKNIQFRPDFSVNFLTESFGLYPVVAKELVRSIQISEPLVEKVQVLEVKKEVSINQNANEKIVREIKPQYREAETQKSSGNIVPIRKKRKVGRYIAIAAITLPIVFYSVWIPLKTDVIKTGVIEVADLNPFRSPVAPSVYKPIVDRNIGKISVGLISENDLGENEIIVETPIENDTDSTLVDNDPIVEEVIVNADFHVIAGCFREDENAENMVSYLKEKGYKAYILDTVNGLKRVSAGSFTNAGEALSSLRDIRGNQVSEAWLLNLRK